MNRLTLLLAVLCVSTVAARGQNWPQFRGPQAAGVADGRPTAVSWDGTKGTNVRWKTAVPGLSHASPVVWGDRVFVVTAVSDDPAPTFKATDRGISLARDEAKHVWKVYALDKPTG